MFKKVRLIFIAGVLVLILFLEAQGLDSFSDVPNENFYQPHIQKLLKSNVITGYVKNNAPTGQFGPNDPINRAAFTKLTVSTRITEEIGEGGVFSSGWEDYSRLEADKKVDGFLTDYYNCTDHPNNCRSIGGKEFLDTPGKAADCSSQLKENQNACEPWFGQYVYYAVNKGFIKGYENPNGGSGRVFKPSESILRIHALKMILADNGNIDGVTDGRFQRLYNLALSRNSYAPKCLKGAENIILKNNGGNDVFSRRLLDYALLADRLDFYGNECQFFTQYNKNTPKERANFLQEPMLRKEAARFFAIAMNYAPVNPDPNQDSTINTANQNSSTLAANKDYVAKNYEQALADGDLNPTSNNPNSPNSSSSPNPPNNPNPPNTPNNPSPASGSSTGTGGSTQYTEYLTESQLDDYMNQNHSQEETRDHFNKTYILPTSKTLIQNWYNRKISEIPKNLDRLYIKHGKTLEEARFIGQTHKRKVDLSYQMVESWYESRLRLKEWVDLDIQTHLWDPNNKHSPEKIKEAALKRIQIAKELTVASESFNQSRLTEYAPYEAPDFQEEVVLRWYLAEPKSITRELYATGGSSIHEIKEMPFRFQVHGGADNNEGIMVKANPNRPTFILIHGWKGHFSDWSKMAQNLHKLKEFSNAQILFLDWNEIVAKANDPNPPPTYSSTWIDHTAKEAVNALKNWKLRPETTFIISHSLGTLLARHIELEIKAQMGGSIGKNIYIDSAAAGPTTYTVNPKGDEFKFFNNSGLCIRAIYNLAGSKDALKSCSEKYLISYDTENLISDFTHENHSKTFGSYEYFTENQLPSGYLSIASLIGNITSHVIEYPYDKNTFSADLFSHGLLHFGKGARDFKFLQIIESHNPNLFTLYGNSLNNTIYCNKDWTYDCLVKSEKGKDNLFREDNLNNMFIADFDKDNDIVTFDDTGAFTTTPFLCLGSSACIEFNGKATVFDGLSRSEVEGWLQIAKGEIKVPPKVFKDNPIKLQ